MILRGTFDCLIHRRDGGITVLELKTGKPAPEHDQQLEMYLTAARAMFPGMPVEGKLVYAHAVRLKPDLQKSGRSATPLEALTSSSRCFARTRISGLADVRTIPRSRRHPHFGSEALAARLSQEGIEYRHFAALGGLRKPRPDSPNGAWRNEAFRGYADHMLTADFAAAVDGASGVRRSSATSP